MSTREVERALHRTRTLYLSLALLVLLCCLGGGWALTSRALRTLGRVVHQLRRIGAEDLHRRLEVPPGRDEFRQLVETLNEMLSRLEGAFEGLRRFNVEIPHELRTPLALIRAEAEAALAGGNARGALENILEEVERLNRLLERMLLAARATGGGLRLSLERVDVVELMEEVREQATLLGAARGVSVGLRLPEGRAWVQGDPVRLRQLLLNLVDNALRHTPRGGKVELGLHRRAGHLLLEVSDTGCGIPPEDLPRVFEPFYRVSRPGHPRGTGLGLSISRAIARGHGGDIELESRPGQGTTVRVRLPAP